ncbi:MAG: hypothetical protein KGN36_01215 [Acidobacteriota bacterium]|nr:hypothetical protein [Acidobacteriota bacterium]
METFKKRQKEMRRLERQRDKAARRMERKLNRGVPGEDASAETNPSAENDPNVDPNSAAPEEPASEV